MEKDNPHPSFTKTAIAEAFNGAVNTYDHSAVIHNVVGERLFERLDLVILQPDVIIDVGTGTGTFCHRLQKRFKHKRVLGIDLSWKMAVNANKQRKWLSKERFLCADAENLPLADGSADLVFSNLMLQWIPNPDQFFLEMQRILVPGGLLMFSCYGPDTLKEMRQSWLAVDEGIHTKQFIDMHDVGDSLTSAAFDGIVMDNETITMTYESLDILHQDLVNVGEANLGTGYDRKHVADKDWQSYLRAYEQYRNGQGDYLASWEITYGHAWATEKMPPRKIDAENDLYRLNITS